MDPDPSMSLAVQLSFLLLLILINAFFAASEMAIVSVNKNRIKVLAQEGNNKATLLLKLLEEPNRFLSTIQVAITLAGFLASAVAATSMSDDIAAFFSKFSIPYPTQIAIVLVTLVLSYISLVLGELFPKRLALQYSEKISMLTVKPIIVVSKITKPFVWLLSTSVSILLRITGVNTTDVEEQYSEEEIKSLLEVGQETGLIKETGKEMITSIFEFDDILAYEIMTPRTDVYMININDSLEDYVDELLEKRFSRVPVYERDIDNIIGILYIKDFVIAARKHGFENVDIKSLLRKPYFVPESKKIDDLFRELQESKVHIAILIDEYGGFSGIVTIEDLIEEVMGDIEDEDEEIEPKFEKIDDNTFLIDGQYYIDDLNDKLLLNLESDRIIELDNLTFKIECVKDRRIDKVKLHVAPISEGKESGEE